LILTGATASGKSAFLYEKLAHLPLTIINADSRQVYRDLIVSSASPTMRELKIHRHELYNFLAADQAFSAGEFIRGAKVACAKAIAEARHPVICGGTYFYIHSLLYGLLPDAPISLEINRYVDELSVENALVELRSLDKVSAAKIHPHNIVKLRRALKLCLAHARPISQIEREGGILSTHDVMLVIFTRARDALKMRAAQRVDQMFNDGLRDEISRFYLKHGDSKIGAATAIGVREFLDFAKAPETLDKAELESVRQTIVQNTHQLIKRQLTWLTNAVKPENTKTIDPALDDERIAELIDQFIR